MSGAGRRAARAVLALAVLVPLLALAWSRSGPVAPSEPAVAAGGYWVSPYGDDDNDGSARHPWRSVVRALAAVPPGATVYLRAGEYRPFTADRPGVTVTSAPGERGTVVGLSGARDVVLVRADRVTVQDIEVRDCVPNPSPDNTVTGDHGSGIRIDGATGVTVHNVHVHHSRGTNAHGLPVGCYGILATGARDLTVIGNEVDHNGAGIAVSGGGRGVLVEGNDVHDQDRIVHNSPEPEDDFGGYGLGATFVTDHPGPIFRNNTVTHNLGPSTDYGVDGGGMEIYAASHVSITGNTFVDNDGALETGTDPGGACAGNTFTGNTVAGRGHEPEREFFTGLILRCAAGMRISGNTFENLSQFTFLITADGGFAGSVAGLRITGNEVIQAGDVVHRVQIVPPAGLPRITVDGNRYRTAGAGFAVIGPEGAPDAGNTVDFPGWQRRTGLDRTSTTG
ncbi:right-handed parallel beta-helix repeat-containing protein [Actinoplanes teichomyceticus]|uniref:Uncharacterized protein DUF1565 n=1 Tax=Actinoplanes teichomyceticus TaxID=1867 RepID=A0A561WM46_ACTTI|nr:right-handed parallel beta-helix repeat-containing protein [Actinoplanes teichomyceticus]TWG24936.1 uncharacterized protein DUF1565 [Actinoplanes teichomyceticus]GIF15527.1 hypothetical protein Ate01nite_55590 [Actinoplanes teichomyceticus]